MALKGIKGATAAAAVVAAVGAGVLAPTAATAATTPHRASVSHSVGSAHFEAQVDNDPGNGAPSWLWQADYKHGDDLGAVTHIYYKDKSFVSIGPTYNGTDTVRLSKEVSRFQVCGLNASIGEESCSPWAYVPYLYACDA
ncbi:hypothetical protein GCM10010330_76800 [Streptomyces tendae]|uniref:hypothetical protein n=1 Tax=Streptomyces tendae TaxID=1932 RepID=UPI00167737F6|nr:hypothetical protein [Streptomyces tendae]GHB11360.1 hypothetical protein GCM10010330_76800 [Streptomyces tendae]